MSDIWHLDEQGFWLKRPIEYRPWLNYLSNGEYGLRISHLGDGFSTTLREPRRVISNYDFFTPNKGRFVFVKEGTGPELSLWNPSYYPTRNPLDEYVCNHGTGWTSFMSVKNGIRVESTHFLPLQGCFEIWKIKVVNETPVRKNISVYPHMEFLLYESFNVDPVYYSWFTNSGMEPDGRTLGFFKTDSSAVFGFMRGLQTPHSWESSLSMLRGNGSIERPEGLYADRLGSVPSAGDPYIACFQYALDLKPGEVWETALFAGEGKVVYEDSRSRFPDLISVDSEFSAVKAEWKKRLQAGAKGKVSDPRLASWLKTFFPYQIYQQSTGLVRSVYRGYRDVAQDAMGMSYFDLSIARELILTLLDKQYDNGRCLRQWNTGGQFNDERDFRDLPLWLPLAVDVYLKNGGDPSILQETRPWLKSEKQASLYEHMVKGLEYVLQFGPHDLITIGKGDWNDALSGLGPEGESLWLNQCAYLALEKFDTITEKYGKEYGLSHTLDIDSLRERLYKGVIAGWNGKWFARAYHENGQIVGSDERIFLLPQAWFTISGMSVRDPEKGRIALDQMIARLENEAGFLKCHPAFDAYDPLVGNLSALAPGMAENFAVYNHASAFAIYALLSAGRTEEARRFIKRLLPIYKDYKSTKAEPYVLVNFYNGGYYPERSGQGGIPWLTGTINWFAMIYFDLMVPQGIDL